MTRIESMVWPGEQAAVEIVEESFISWTEEDMIELQLNQVYAYCFFDIKNLFPRARTSIVSSTAMF